MTQNLVHQRCFNHAAREAVARCPECLRFFCRECVTEHDDRVLCAICLKNLAGAASGRRPVLATLARLLPCVFCFLVAWFFFFLIGEALLRLPSSFHEGTLWHVDWMDQE